MGFQAQHHRWACALLICWVLFVNHFTRDITGALESAIEKDMGISRTEFQALNSMYFAPNLVCPLVAGFLAQKIGAPRLLVLVLVIAFVGNLVIAIAAAGGTYRLLLTGRVILGLTHESTDIMPLLILAPLFADGTWGAVVGLFGAILRLGSVTNFALSPLIYNASGLSGAFWASFAVGCTGFIAALLSVGAEKKARAWLEPARSGASISTGGGGGAGSEGAPAEGAQEDMQGLASALIFALFCGIGILLYAAIAPFWFYGSGFFQSKWGYTQQQGDSLTLLSEVNMVILSPIFGIATDKLLKSIKLRLAFTVACQMLIAFSYALLIVVPASSMPPLVGAVLLGIGFATCLTLYWSLSGAMVPKAYQALGSGIFGCSVYLGVSTLPIVMGSLRNKGTAMALLGISAFLAAALTFVTYGLWPRTPPQDRLLPSMASMQEAMPSIRDVNNA